MPGNFPLDGEAAKALKQKINDLDLPITAIVGNSASAYFPGDDDNDNVQMGAFRQNYARSHRMHGDGQPSSCCATPPRRQPRITYCPAAVAHS